MTTRRSKFEVGRKAGELDGVTPAGDRKPNEYLSKHQLYPFQISASPNADLGLVIVLPCYDEPELNAALESLWACARPPCDVEVIIVINSSDADNDAVKERNRRTAADTNTWISTHRDPGFRFYVLLFPCLPARHAGVGLARKLGMDEAFARLQRVGNASGIIVGFDADCTCDPSYLTAIETHFSDHPASNCASIHFEHPLAGPLDDIVYTAIAHYELFLRYYVHALRYSGFPHAYYTVGSCMAVRAETYARQGGMNRRQAGEDFYFLHKLIPLGGFSEIRDTTVRPSPRISRRVPFGTGKAIADWVVRGKSARSAYAPEVFRHLKILFAAVDGFYAVSPDESEWVSGLPPVVSHYLMTSNFAHKLRELQDNTASIDAFKKRFFRWFTGIRTLKFVHWATDRDNPEEPIEQGATTLLRWQGLLDGHKGETIDVSSLLLHYRRMDREGRLIPFGNGDPNDHSRSHATSRTELASVRTTLPGQIVRT